MRGKEKGKEGMVKEEYEGGMARGIEREREGGNGEEEGEGGWREGGEEKEEGMRKDEGE